MMKTILLLLIAMGSSSALAQHNVPGGGPVGSPGNPGTYHPPYGGAYPGNGGYHPAPYPQPNPYPNPYPGNTYPTPSYPVGPCVINQQYNGGQTYVVYDGYGDFITSTYDYNQAVRTAEEYDQMGYCRGIKINVNQPNPYPNPYPPNTFCSVMPGQDAYGNQFYRVLDRAGRIIYTSPNYQQALRISQTDQRCFQ